ncbi:MAG: dihydrofolate reductase family protein [Pseudomonadota bacterium]
MEVFSNSAISLDGRLGTASYDHLRLGSEEDLRRMDLLRARADAVLGAGAPGGPGACRCAPPRPPRRGP